MLLKISVNQREAIRRGFNADSTVKIDLDVSCLHPTVRNFVADRFYHGTLLQSATKDGQSVPSDTKEIVINRPDPQGLREAIEEAMKAEKLWVRWLTKSDRRLALEKQHDEAAQKAKSLQTSAQAGRALSVSERAKLDIVKKLVIDLEDQLSGMPED